MKIVFTDQEEKDWFISLLDYARDAGFVATSDRARATGVIGEEGDEGVPEGFLYDDAIRDEMAKIAEEHVKRMWSFLLAFRAACRNAKYSPTDFGHAAVIHKDVPFVEGDKSFCVDGSLGMGMMVDVPKLRPWAATWSVNS